MNIMVCVKQVPDNAVVPKLDPSTGKVMTQGVETMVSPFDLNAIEAGLTLVSEHGGEVSVITAGDDSCKTALRIGLSMGAEKAYLVCDSALEDSDTWATSYTLAASRPSTMTPVRLPPALQSSWASPRSPTSMKSERLPPVPSPSSGSAPPVRKWLPPPCLWCSPARSL